MIFRCGMKSMDAEKYVYMQFRAHHPSRLQVCHICGSDFNFEDHCTYSLGCSKHLIKKGNSIALSTSVITGFSVSRNCSILTFLSFIFILYKSLRTGVHHFFSSNLLVIHSTISWLLWSWCLLKQKMKILICGSMNRRSLHLENGGKYPNTCTIAMGGRESRAQLKKEVKPLSIRT